MNNDLMALQASLLNKDGEIQTTSLDIALHFGKKHYNVLADIKNLHSSHQFTKLNFQVSFKNNDLANGKQDKYYQISKDGFTMLCMGYTGRKAMYWKELYIQAFNQLQQQSLNQAQQISVLQQALLDSNPLWQSVLRYKNMGLNHGEIARLLALNSSTVRGHVRKLERFGVLQAPVNLLAMQQMAGRFQSGELA